MQAALLGQGIAIGWLNVAAHWLRSGAFVPVGDRIISTGRHCQFVRSRDRSDRPVVAAVRDWIIVRLREDLAEIDKLYPHRQYDRFWHRHPEIAASRTCSR